MGRSIPLSPKHGLNPAIPKCFFCLKDKNQIILAGRMPGDAEAPRGVVWDHEPCDECAAFMEQGVILISLDESKTTDQKNPWRTGGWCVVKDEAIERLHISPPELKSAILRQRVAFIPDDAWEMLGLPRETKGQPR